MNTRSLLSVRGRGMLALGLLGSGLGIALGQTYLLRFGLLFLLLLGGSWVWLQSLRVVQPQRQVSSTELVRGDGLSITFSGLTPSSWGQQPYRIQGTLHSQIGTPDVVLRPECAGILVLEPWLWHRGDPLGLWWQRRTLGHPVEIRVLPRLIDLEPWVAPPTAQNPWALPSGSGDPEYSLRAYRHGDDPRWVHWPSTARRDTLMVRPPSYPQRGQVRLELDFSLPAPTQHQGLLDAAASIGQALIDGGAVLEARLASGQVWQSQAHGAGAVRSLQRFLSDPGVARPPDAPLHGVGSLAPVQVLRLSADAGPLSEVGDVVTLWEDLASDLNDVSATSPARDRS